MMSNEGDNGSVRVERLVRRVWLERFLRTALAWAKKEKNLTDWKIAKFKGEVIYSETSMAVYKENLAPNFELDEL